MASILNPIITQGGLAALYNAQNTGVQLALTHIGFGTGAYDPDGQEAALKGEVARVAIASGSRITPTQIRVAAVWSDAAAKADVTEVGFYAGTVLFAVLSRATGGPYVYKTPAADLVFSYDWTMKAIPASSVSITTDPTQSAMLALLAAHEQNPDAHAQYAKLTDLAKAISDLKGGLKLSRVSVSGPALVYPGTTNTYTLTDYDSFSTYSVTTDVGTATISGDTITLVIASGQASGPLNLAVKRDEYTGSYQVAVGAKSVGQPSIASPAANASNVSREPTLTSTDFKSYPSGADTHASTDWQISTDSTFATINWQSMGDAANKTSIAVPSGTLSISTVYYARVRHTGATLGASPWSVASKFTVTSQYVVTPTLSAPAAGATAVSQTPTLTSSAFSSYPTGDVHLSSRWQLSKASDFSSIAHDSGALTTKLTSYSLADAGVVLDPKTVYYARVRHAGKSYGDSSWSPVVSFTTTDMVAGTYTNLPTFSTQKRAYHNGATLNGIGYVSAGWYNETNVGVQATLWAYDPVANAWSQKATAPQTTLGAPLVGAAGKLYRLGGVDTFGSNSQSYWRNTNYVYDPVANTWSTAAALPDVGRAHACADVLNDKIYLFGGSTYNGYLNTLSVYSPTSNAWTALATGPSGRGNASLTALGGKLYLFGGHSSVTASGSSGDRAWPVNASGLSDLWVYDPVANSWASLAPAPVTRHSHNAYAINGKLYIFGGSGTTETAATGSTSLYCYDPATNKWTYVNSTSAVYGLMFGCAGFAIKSSMYVNFGYNPNGGMRWDFYRID